MNFRSHLLCIFVVLISINGFAQVIPHTLTTVTTTTLEGWKSAVTASYLTDQNLSGGALDWTCDARKFKSLDACVLHVANQLNALGCNWPKADRETQSQPTRCKVISANTNNPRLQCAPALMNNCSSGGLSLTGSTFEYKIDCKKDLANKDAVYVANPAKDPAFPGVCKWPLKDKKVAYPQAPTDGPQ